MGRVRHSEVQYIAPMKDGDAFVKVEAKDGARTPRIGKGETTIRVVAAGTSEPANKSFWKGSNDLSGGNFTSAIKFFSETISKVPTYSPAYIGIGVSQTAKGDWEAAIENYNIAVSYEPKNGFLYLLRAQAYQRLGASSNASADISFLMQLSETPTTLQMIRTYQQEYDPGKRELILKSAIAAHSLSWAELDAPYAK